MTASSRIQRVSVGRGLPKIEIVNLIRKNQKLVTLIVYTIPITEIRAVPASANSSGNPRFFNSFANHNTILLKLLGQNGIEEWVAATV